MSNSININVDEITLNEMIEFEDITGDELASVVERPGVKHLRALIYISQKRTNPKFTIEEAGEYKVSELDLGAETSAPLDE